MRIDELLPRAVSSAAAILLGALMAAQAGGEPRASGRPIVLEVIVKFSVESVLGREVSRMLQANTTDTSALIEPLAELEQSLRIPLEPVGITSGREIILRVREAAALEQVREACLKSPSVTRAEVRETQADNPMLATHRLLVGFPASSRESRLVQEAEHDAGKGDEIQALASKLAAPSAMAVTSAVEAGEWLSITLDRAAVLSSLVESLRGMSQVEYVQANTLLQTMQ